MKTIIAIFKIGGAGLMLPFQELFDLVCFILKDKKETGQTIIVVSALAGITRKLENIFQSKASGNIPQAMKIFEEIKKIHFERCKELFINDLDFLFDYLDEIKYFIQEGKINKNNETISKAYLLKYGELLSSEIFKRFLLDMKLSVNFSDARDTIVCFGKDYCNSQANVSESGAKIYRLLKSTKSKDILLTQGYIGKSTYGKDKLMGLDSSDLTASLFALCVRLYQSNSNVELTYFKDKLGVLDKNDNLIKFLSYEEYARLESGPVRKDAIEILKWPKVKARVRSFTNLENEGTLIG